MQCTHLVVDHLCDWVIQATVIVRPNIGYKVFIPKIVITPLENSEILVAL